MKNIFLVVSLAVATGAWASEKPAAPKVTAPAPYKEKSVEFEAGRIEGVNKGPGDFSTRVTNWKEKKEHLYKKSISFDQAMHDTLREVRYSQ